jgi:predicted HTH domain antitoxin
MSAVRVIVELPEDIAGTKSPADLALELRMFAIFDAFRNGVISTGRAASLLGVSRPVFLFFAGQHGVPSVDYAVEDLAAELEAFDQAQRAG